MKEKKTNAMRQLEQHNIPYTPVYYDLGNREFSGETASEVLALSPTQVYKTLTTTNTKNEYFIFILPVNMELDLKKAAAAAGEKKVEMVAVKELLKITGYQRGEVSPLGMKKNYPTFLDSSMEKQDLIYISAGKKGHSISINPLNLQQLLQSIFVNLSKE